jgi:hypothetical protein
VRDVYVIVREIRAERFPRNRNFEAHARIESVLARRVHRFLRAVERDLLVADEVALARTETGWLLSLGFPAMRLKREVALTDEEHALLVEDPRLAARLSSVAG